jgi:glutamate dehydrogenase/leucine dehydrogenase
VKLFFDRAAKKTGIPPDYLDIIKACDTVVRFNIPLVRDNGTLETVTCYR